MAKEVKVKRVGKTKNSPRRKTGTKPVEQISKREKSSYTRTIGEKQSVTEWKIHKTASLKILKRTCGKDLKYYKQPTYAIRIYIENFFKGFCGCVALMTRHDTPPQPTHGEHSKGSTRFTICRIEVYLNSFHKGTQDRLSTLRRCAS